ncbi:MAG: ferrous iron transport protein B [Vulcanococcus sp.]|uniref:ferrous iron transport protein B n=1 Tax=Vulcanococcus sp. TaxID=2856995 RepID=UPI0025D65A47|nr:ferrous iron transport protein B [Vulcanococcus sp.]MBW0173407.1 ferrous iron transport protein B [Vulcanococcus sp.]MBW0180103.1 ferrous iron transport protein B [Vulcanococcus sp.]
MSTIAVLGMPNTGKSTLFNRLTGHHAHIGNWPGLTVDLMQAELQLSGRNVQLVDLPGIYDLRGHSDDEAVVRRFLEQTPVDLVLVVLNASQLDRQLRLALQVQQLGLPAVVALNMADEAARFGVSINAESLGAALGQPVLPLSAKYRQGLETLQHTLLEQLEAGPMAAVPEQLEERLAAADADLEGAMAALVERSVTLPGRWRDSRSRRLDAVLLHPLLGLPLFFLAMALMFQGIYAIGVPVQEALGGLLDQFGQLVLKPLLAPLPALLQGFLLEGHYQGLGTVMAFLPVIALFFLAMGVVEDSGYLSRAAYLMDAFMERIGLDGRSFVLSLMGFGCNVPAILGTRVMRDRGLRLLSMLVIPFSLCSARLNVFLFMAAVFFPPRIGGLVIFGLYLMSCVAAMLTALLFRGRFPSNEPLVLELPPYRLPTAGQMLSRAWSEVKHFWLWSRRFIIFGVVAVWLLNNLPVGVEPASSASLAGQLGRFTQPLLAPIGINPKLAVALLFGFIAKEIVLGGLAVIYGQADPAALSRAIASDVSWPQAVSFMLFTLLYTPCLSTVAVIRSESKKLSFTLLSVAWSLLLAWLVSFVAFQTITRLS